MFWLWWEVSTSRLISCSPLKNGFSIPGLWRQWLVSARGFGTHVVGLACSIHFKDGKFQCPSPYSCVTSLHTYWPYSIPRKMKAVLNLKKGSLMLKRACLDFEYTQKEIGKVMSEFAGSASNIRYRNLDGDIYHGTSRLYSVYICLFQSCTTNLRCVYYECVCISISLLLCILCSS